MSAIDVPILLNVSAVSLHSSAPASLGTGEYVPILLPQFFPHLLLLTFLCTPKSVFPRFALDMCPQLLNCFRSLCLHSLVNCYSLLTEHCYLKLIFMLEVQLLSMSKTCRYTNCRGFCLLLMNHLKN
jgi:hypothetical protein